MVGQTWSLMLIFKTVGNKVEKPRHWTWCRRTLTYHNVTDTNNDPWSQLEQQKRGYSSQASHSGKGVAEDRNEVSFTTITGTIWSEYNWYLAGVCDAIAAIFVYPEWTCFVRHTNLTAFHGLFHLSLTGQSEYALYLTPVRVWVRVRRANFNPVTFSEALFLPGDDQ